VTLFQIFQAHSPKIRASRLARVWVVFTTSAPFTTAPAILASKWASLEYLETSYIQVFFFLFLLFCGSTNERRWRKVQQGPLGKWV
jgi:hypothetical protein